MIKKILLAIFIAGLVGSGFLYSKRVRILEYIRNFKKEQIPIAISFEDAKKPTADGQQPALKNSKSPTPDSELPTAVKLALPESINLAVPFTSQAPYANWGEPYQDACEEAAVAMAHYFFEKKIFTVDSADSEILDLVSFEERRFGYGYDITAEETANVIRHFYGYKKVEVVYNPTIDMVKDFLAKGLPVIAPVYGRALENPYYTLPGPIYHMLVIKGYTKDKFITNDPGTRRGADYLYSYDIMKNAIHDWNNGDVEHGRKVIIIIYPN